MRPPFKIEIAVIFVAIGLPMCQCRQPGQSALSTDPEVAQRQIEHLIPKGTRSEKAAETLKARGFNVSRASGNFAGETYASYLYGDLSGPGHPVKRRWQVAVILEDETASGYQVTTGLIGP